MMVMLIWNKIICREKMQYNAFKIWSEIILLETSFETLVGNVNNVQKKDERVFQKTSTRK